MRKWLAALVGVTSALFGTAAGAAVIVLGNYNSGEVVIQGNQGGSEIDRAVQFAKGGQDAGWSQIFGPDDDRPGWGTVLCVRHSKGFFFAEANGASSEAEAIEIANIRADKFLDRYGAEVGGGTKVKCAPTWNNNGQAVDYVGKPLGDGTDVAESKPDDGVPIASAKQAEQPADKEPESPALAESEEALPAPKRDYEAEYQAKMAVWMAELKEQERKAAEYEDAVRRIEVEKMAQAARAREAEEAHQRELDRHAEQVAALDQQYRRQLDQWRTGSADAVIGFPEAVSVCTFDTNDGQSKFGNWKCFGPLQFSYAKLADTGAASQQALLGVRDSCGGKVESVRDLGMINGYRVFGCSFGINPDPKKRNSLDAAQKFGLERIDGRILFQCPASKASCNKR